MSLRSYTNSDGMTVEVTTEHLDFAVEVKLELQETSPSRKCSWNKHKQIMKENGYSNSDKNESYRCLIKNYQKSIGRLHNLPKYADLVHTSKLDAIKSMVGDFRFEKQANQDILREVNKTIREMSRTAVMVDEFRNILLDEIDFSVPHYVYEPKAKNSKNKGILVITDWHIGVIVNNCVGNYYNYDIAVKRLQQLKKKVLDKCSTHNVSDLHIVGLGDWIEHLYMRKNQSQDCEFSLNMQIAKAKKLIFDLIVSIAEHNINVTFGSIAGNHDRGHGDKSQSFDDDNANVVIMEGIKDMLEIKKADRIELLDIKPHDTEINLELNGRTFKFVHGDKDRGGMKNRLKQHISMGDRFFDYLVHGHLHHYYFMEDDNGRGILGTGSLVGCNNYSKEIGSSTDASQTFILVEEDGEVTPMRIGLQII